jgi:hypothetical protein
VWMEMELVDGVEEKTKELRAGGGRFGVGRW